MDKTQKSPLREIKIARKPKAMPAVPPVRTIEPVVCPPSSPATKENQDA